MTNPFKAVRILVTVSVILSLALVVFTFFNFKDLSLVADPQEVVTEKKAIDKPHSIIINEPLAAAGAIVFKNNCKVCHRIDKNFVGPPLRDVYLRRDPQWIRRWIVSSSKMIASGDPTAIE